jgi:hypothetical protein
MDNGQQAITVAHLSFQLRWAKNVGTHGKVLSQGTLLWTINIQPLAMVFQYIGQQQGQGHMIKNVSSQRKVLSDSHNKHSNI